MDWFRLANSVYVHGPVARPPHRVSIGTRTGPVLLTDQYRPERTSASLRARTVEPASITVGGRRFEVGDVTASMSVQLGLHPTLLVDSLRIGHRAGAAGDLTVMPDGPWSARLASCEGSVVSGSLELSGLALWRRYSDEWGEQLEAGYVHGYMDVAIDFEERCMTFGSPSDILYVSTALDRGPGRDVEVKTALTLELCSPVLVPQVAPDEDDV